MMSARPSLAEVRPGGIIGFEWPLAFGLIAGTVLAEGCSSVLQGTLWWVLVETFCRLIGIAPPAVVWFMLAAVLLLPFLLAGAAMLAGAGGRIWQAQVGGRRPSDREQRLLDAALAALRERDPRLAGPRSWFVLDTPAIRACCSGQTLMLSRGLLHSPWLAAALAHELSHLASWDARLTAALSALFRAPLRQQDSGERDVEAAGLLAQLGRPLAMILAGELASHLTRPAWGAYFRAREYRADLHAARLGQAQQLIEVLERYGPEAPEPFALLKGVRHPPIEHRIQRIHRYQQAHAHAWIVFSHSHQQEQR